MFTKGECRSRFRLMRDRLSDEEYARLNEQLLNGFKEISLKDIRYIHTFLPILHQREPNTFLVIEYLRTVWPDIKIIVPRSDLQTNLMTHHVLWPNQELTRNRWGIIEPHESDEVIEEELIDLILLPLLAFDKKGGRVGYGKGYYDRFLNLCKDNAQKVGLSLFGPVDRIIDIQPHDVPLDRCITPDKIWEF